MMERAQQSPSGGPRWSRLRFVLLAVLAAAGVFAPWGSSHGGGTWIAAASWAAAHHLAAGLEAASRLVTVVAGGLAVLGAVLRLLAQRRGGAYAAALGLLAVCVPLTLLMPEPGAACFLAGCFAVLIYDLARVSRAAARTAEPATAASWFGALTREAFSILSAGAFLAFGWQYNSQLLTRLILVAAGLALIARAALPSGFGPAFVRTGEPGSEPGTTGD